MENVVKPLGCKEKTGTRHNLSILQGHLRLVVVVEVDAGPIRGCWMRFRPYIYTIG